MSSDMCCQDTLAESRYRKNTGGLALGDGEVAEVVADGLELQRLLVAQVEQGCRGSG
jgi:hypothetical protein